MKERRVTLDAVNALAKIQQQMSGDEEIASKISQYEMAYRMRSSIPEVADISSEPDHILDMYGPEVRKPGTFARNCLLARRLAERDVRFISLFQTGWDHHNGLAKGHPVDCRYVDQPSAALVTDLKQRGLLKRHPNHLGQRIWPDQLRARQFRRQLGTGPSRREFYRLAGWRRYQGRTLVWRDRRFQLQHCEESAEPPRSPRDHAVYPGHRPRTADLPVARPGFSAHGRPRRSHSRRAGARRLRVTRHGIGQVTPLTLRNS